MRCGEPKCENEDCVVLSKEEAKKETAGKPPMHLLPPRALPLVADAFGYGAEKYGAWNYLKGAGLPMSGLQAAAMRHINAWARGEDIDRESGCRHLAMAAACTMMMLQSQECGVGVDDRWQGGH